MIKVTIMIPTYNQEDYIIETIQSALSQNYQNLEVVVCDDCSQDKTFQLINSIKDKRLKIYRNQENLGRVKNYRKLLYELATGDFVINLDGDDYFIDQYYIKKCIDLINKNNIDLVFSNQIIKYENKEKYTNMDLTKLIDGNWLFLNYGKNGIHIPHMTVLYNRRKAIKIGFYQKDIISSDWESLLKFVINSKIGFIKENSGVWRQVENSESKVQDIQKVLNNFKLVESVSAYASNYFDEKNLRIWKDRINSNLLKDIAMGNISCNLFRILSCGYTILSKMEFLRLLFNYRFIGKIIIGKLKYSCVE